ncbi:putative holin-like toxin [Staphylococcus epidermidis]|nr:putative holin-like toxin [Staphylococcus epidermidis]
MTTNFERKSDILVTIATMLQFGIFLIALIGLVIKLIDLSQKK